MNSVVLTPDGRTALTDAVSKYSGTMMGRTDLITKLCMDIQEAGESFSKATFYRIEQLTPVKEQTVQTLFRFLNLSQNIVADGLATYEADIAIQIISTKPSHLRWNAHAEGLFFGSDGKAQFRILQTFYEKNPKGFFTFVINNQIVGCLVIIPIKEQPLKKFAAGLISESNISCDDIYSPDEAGLVRSIYVESLIINIVDGKHRARIYRDILLQANILLKDICEPARLQTVYALAASEVGERLLTTFKFQFIPPRHKDRKDGRKMFAKPYREISYRLLGKE